MVASVKRHLIYFQPMKVANSAFVLDASNDKDVMQQQHRSPHNSI